MILGFKPQFVEPILNGTKIHSIRTDVHDRWQVGNQIQMATGVRTKNYKCFADKKCLGIQYIFMTYSYLLNCLEISIGSSHYCDKYLYQKDKELLAKQDGFANVLEFENWFVPLIKASPEDCFKGKIIHWTEFKYPLEFHP